MKSIILGIASMLMISANASSNNNEYLVKFNKTQVSSNIKTMSTSLPAGSKVEALPMEGWVKVQFPKSGFTPMAVNKLSQMPGVEHMQPNYRLKIYNNYKLSNPEAVAELRKRVPTPNFVKEKDNPDFPASASGGSGNDPEFSKQWGMEQNNVKGAWNLANTKGSSKMIVAVIDTGVDYTHEDLWDNMWKNPGETGLDANGKDKSTNGIDDDKNGYIDDVVGWDVVKNDNKPYDLTADPMDMLMKGGNPGHGTHCAGNVAARADNGKGIAGVAPGVQMMALRFLGDEGGGTTADAVIAIRYAVDNGAKVLSNSWGSEGEDPQDAKNNQALKDAINYAMSKDVLFIAAAGNGHQGVGYDNDTDAKPGYPASYDMDNIISVAAMDIKGEFGSFSNWGAKTVDIGAPGVKVFSTITDRKVKYSDMVINDESIIELVKMLVEMQGGKFERDMLAWSGTSMATPHVAGAAALYWSAHPEKTYKEVKAAILGSVKKTSVLSGKVTSGGQMDVMALMGVK